MPYTNNSKGMIPIWAIGLMVIFVGLVSFAFIKDYWDARSLPKTTEQSPSPISSQTPTPSTSTSPTPKSSAKTTAKPSASASTKASATPSPTAQPTQTPSPTPTPMPKPKCTNSSIPPASGPAPLQVFLHGSGEAQGNSGLVGYQWDYDGNGSWDSDVKLDEVKYTYTNPGQYHPKYRILGSNDQWSDTCTYPYTITVTAN